MQIFVSAKQISVSAKHISVSAKQISALRLSSPQLYAKRLLALQKSISQNIVPEIIKGETFRLLL